MIPFLISKPWEPAVFLSEMNIKHNDINRSIFLLKIASLTGALSALILSCNAKPVITIDGSSTVYAMVERAAESFHRTNPNILVETTVSGTGGGLRKFCTGSLDIATASRMMTRSEAMDCARHSVPFREIPIALDGIAVVVHPTNQFVNDLTIQELKRIYSADDAAVYWSDIRSWWPRRKIIAFSPGEHNGTYDFFKMSVLDGKTPMRTDAVRNTNPSVLSEGIAEEKDAIGYFSLGYTYEHPSNHRLVAIRNPLSQQPVLPGQTTVREGKYAPLSRPLFLYVKEGSLKKESVRIYLSFFFENATTISEITGHVPFHPDIYKKIKDSTLSMDSTAMFEFQDRSFLDQYRHWQEGMMKNANQSSPTGYTD